VSKGVRAIESIEKHIMMKDLIMIGSIGKNTVKNGASMTGNITYFIREEKIS
jgi:hypothetical protein